MRKLHGLLGSIFLLSFAAGCTVESTDPSRSGGVDPAGDECTGEGHVAISIRGLPAGAAGKVTITGPGGSRTVAENADLTLAAGEYTVEAAAVTTPDPIARTMYKGSVSRTSVKACSETTADVSATYEPIATSNKVWMGNQNGTAPVLGFASSELTSTASIQASVSARTQGGRGIAFDREGNLWAIGGTTADPTLVRYPAASLGVSSDKTPDRAINVPSSCAPFAMDLAFDGTGNLWIAATCANNVFQIKAADLAASGDATPNVVIGNVAAPRGLAFDGAGNLWVAAGTIRRFDAARLGASTSEAADAVLTVTGAPSEQLAFDAAGNLWSVGGSEENLARIVKADLSATGEQTIAIPLQISVGVGALPERIAFDESGGMWIATSAGSFARLAPDQLTTPSTYAAPTVPERTITSGDVGSALSIAIFPAPAGLPLYSSIE